MAEGDVQVSRAALCDDPIQLMGGPRLDSESRTSRRLHSIHQRRKGCHDTAPISEFESLWSPLGLTHSQPVKKGVDAGAGEVGIRLEICSAAEVRRRVTPLAPSGQEEMFEGVLASCSDIRPARKVEDRIKGCGGELPCSPPCQTWGQVSIDGNRNPADFIRYQAGASPFEKLAPVSGAGRLKALSPALPKVMQEGILPSRFGVSRKIAFAREPGRGVPPLTPTCLGIVAEGIDPRKGDVLVGGTVEDRIKGRRKGSVHALREDTLAHAEIPVPWWACVQQKTISIN